MSARGFLLTILLLLLLGVSTGRSQEQVTIDSFEAVLQSQPRDTNRVLTLIDYGIAYDYTVNNSIPLFKEAQAIAKELGHWELEAYCFKLMGVTHYYVSEFDQCLMYWEKSRDLYARDGQLQEVANTHNNIGNVYLNLSRYPEALEQYQSCLKTSEELGSKKGIAASYGNIGNVYEKLDDLPKALTYHYKSLEIDRDRDNVAGMAITTNNIGAIYEMRGKLDSAIHYLKVAEALYGQIDDQLGISATYENQGNIFLKQGNLKEALALHQSSLRIDSEYDNKAGMIISYDGIGRVLAKMKLYDEAEKHFLAGLSLAEEVGSPALLKNLHGSISELYRTMGKSALAYDHLTQYVQLKDSLFNQRNAEEIARKEMQYTFYKKQFSDSLQREAENQQTARNHQLELGQQKTVTNVSIIAGGVIFLIMLIVAIVIYRNYQEKTRANLTISAQKAELEKKSRETTDSIKYAKHIQEVVFPTHETIRKSLPESFIFFKPRDIVSGDFYWLAEVSDVVIFAVVDCTGHGVPGAFISLMGHTGLRQAVMEQRITDPAQILEFLNKTVNETLKQSFQASKVRDGMDMSLCAYHRNSRRLYFAGAINPLYIVHEGEVNVVRGDVNSVGGFIGEDPEHFTTQEIDLKPDSTLYLFTDGYPDQFGGEKGKKFKYNRFRELLIKASALPMAEQRQLLEDTLRDWQGNLEQVDDICVMGVRLP